MRFTNYQNDGIAEFVEPLPRVVITEKFLMAGATANCGWNREQLRCLGVPWPLKSGWKKRLCGKVVGGLAAARFLVLKGCVKKGKRASRALTR